MIESQLHQSEQSKELQQRIHELKGSLGSTELEVSKWKARYDALMEQHQGLDLTMTDLDNRCEVKAAFPSSGGGTEMSAVQPTAVKTKMFLRSLAKSTEIICLVFLILV